MKRYGLALLLLCCLPVFASCGASGKDQSAASPEPDTEIAQGQDAQEAYHKISAEEAKAMMDEGGVTIVDVRRAEEYTEKHIPGAILVTNETIGAELLEEGSLLPDLDAVLLVYCRTGVRSKQASDKLVELGYKNVYDFGGIVDWTYDTESGAFAVEQ